MKFNKRIFWMLFVLLVLFVVPVVLAQTETPPIVLPPITALSLGAIIATIVSLSFDYFPGLAAKYDTLSVAAKRQIALVMAVVIVGAMFTMTCFNLVSTNLVCSLNGAWDAVSSIIYVFVIGQGVHTGTKPTAAFKADTLNIDPKAKGK